MLRLFVSMRGAASLRMESDRIKKSGMFVLLSKVVRLGASFEVLFRKLVQVCLGLYYL